jgi:hypothetical protein
MVRLRIKSADTELETCPRQPVTVVMAIEHEADTNLPEIAEAFGQSRLFLGPRHGRQQQTGQNAHNSNHHQQFNEGKRLSPDGGVEWIGFPGFHGRAQFLLTPGIIPVSARCCKPNP